jgi:hypothetical protein
MNRVVVFRERGSRSIGPFYLRSGIHLRIERNGQLFSSSVSVAAAVVDLLLKNWNATYKRLTECFFLIGGTQPWQAWVRLYLFCCWYGGMFMFMILLPERCRTGTFETSYSMM